MHTAESALDPMLSDVGRPGTGVIPAVRRYVWSRWHAREFRAFVLGMVAATPEIPHDRKEGFVEWLAEADWPAVLRAFSGLIGWKQRHGSSVAVTTVLSSEIGRLFRCFKMGRRVTGPFVI
ncbi:hypothetical protein FJY94_02060 [Candidatus Kaiserbacteria bacterium]|nr:hypothetical protein [Candidatus Kaiserbacteria bacterium]